MEFAELPQKEAALLTEELLALWGASFSEGVYRPVGIHRELAPFGASKEQEDARQALEVVCSDALGFFWCLGYHSTIAILFSFTLSLTCSAAGEHTFKCFFEEGRGCDNVGVWSHLF